MHVECKFINATNFRSSAYFIRLFRISIFPFSKSPNICTLRVRVDAIHNSISITINIFVSVSAWKLTRNPFAVDQICGSTGYAITWPFQLPGLVFWSTFIDGRRIITWYILYAVYHARSRSDTKAIKIYSKSCLIRFKLRAISCSVNPIHTHTLANAHPQNVPLVSRYARVEFYDIAFWLHLAKSLYFSNSLAMMKNRFFNSIIRTLQAQP